MLWYEVVAVILGFMFWCAFIGLFFFCIVLLIIQTIHTDRMKKDFIDMCGEHDKAVIMAYKNCTYDLFRRFKKKHKDK